MASLGTITKFYFAEDYKNCKDALLPLLLSLLLSVLLTLLRAVLRAMLWILSLLLKPWPPESRSPLIIYGATAYSSFGD
ncbi:hypothetical protein RR46_09865 [Papilio xuthus]|uniref:Uncharacterized protein n=1 Tax=Papilio xuthus TaxID=66420 RepID=A0A194QB20_PAPXU|nr:hypothetical protein RR46_09865 [Papilio xuthus]